MIKISMNAVLSGVAAVIVASMAVTAHAQAPCPWPTKDWGCAPPPPGIIITAPGGGALSPYPYVPGSFGPTNSVVHAETRYPGPKSN